MYKLDINMYGGSGSGSTNFLAVGGCCSVRVMVIVTVNLVVSVV